MKKLFKYLKQYRIQSILAPILKLVEVCFELSVPLIIANIIDIGIAESDRGYVVNMCLILLLLAVLGLVCAVSAQYFAAKASVGFAHDIRSAAYSHILKLSYSQKDTLGSDTLVTRLTSDINQIQTGLNLTLRLLLRSPFVVLGAVIMAFTIDTGSALIFVAVIPLLCAATFFVMLICVPMYKKVQAKLDGVLGLTRENLSGVRVIRAFGAENAEIEKFRQNNNALAAKQRKTGRISSLLNPITAVIINAAIIALIYTGAIRVDSGTLTQGQVVALCNYMAQILVELIKFANLIINISKSVACASRVSAILDTPEGMTFPITDTKPSETAPAVEFRGVYMSYSEGGDDAIEDISFTLEKGKTLGIIGGTGSGKTTLCNLIPRFYDAEAGEVSVFGNNVKSYTAQTLRSIVGTVPQSAELFSGTIRENLLFGGIQATDEELYKALDIAQGSEFVKSRAEGLDYIVEQGGKNLSGGQRQRLTIARALARKPSILILDDSGSALDYATDAKLRRALHNIGDMTVIIISQRVSCLQNCDEIIVLDDGKIAGIGTQEQLLAECTAYKEIYDSQVRE